MLVQRCLMISLLERYSYNDIICCPCVFYMMMDLFAIVRSRLYFGRDEIIPLLTYSPSVDAGIVYFWINTALPKVMIASSLGYSEGEYTHRPTPL